MHCATRRFSGTIMVMAGRIIAVSNRLPVSVIEKDGVFTLKRSIGGLATALAAVSDQYDLLWVGWPGNKRYLSKARLKDMNFPKTLVPVSIPDRLFKHYYDYLANGTLWPLMHGIKPSRLAQKADWSATYEVTARFADAIRKNVRPDDVIWMHDYHLVLLPKMLRDEGMSNRLGIFLHTPFPSVKTLFKWKHYRRMLESLSQVDVLGLQTERDADNFKACLKAANITMRKDARVQAFPIGVDYKYYHDAAAEPPVKMYLRKFKKALTGKKVILSVSRLDYTKGIIEQLKAVEKAIKSYGPERATYKLVVAPSRETVAGYKELKEQIDTTVTEINERFNKKYGVEPIEFAYRSHGFDELSAWYRIADVLLVTPKIDGMNLVVKEYIAARNDERGAIVLSETIGAAFQLRDAILVNPQNIGEIADGLRYALTMPALERIRRWRALRSNVRRENVFWWTKQFLAALQAEPSAHNKTNRDS